MPQPQPSNNQTVQHPHHISRPQTAHTAIATRTSLHPPLSLPPFLHPDRQPPTTHHLLDSPPFPRTQDDHNPLPLLQLFTPFTIAHTTTAPLPPPSSSQTHTLTLTSPHALLTASLTLTLHPATLQLTALAPPALHATLGPYLAPALAALDIAAVGHALASHWAVATRRARCWAGLAALFPHLLPDGMRNGKGTGKGEGRESDSDRLARHFHRAAVTLAARRRPGPRLTVAWRIAPHALTGDAESRVTASVAVPGAWREADARGVWAAKVPVLFERLVGEVGVLGAVRVIGEVVFGGGGGE